MSALKVGVSFHSFTNEYCSLKWSFEDMMQLTSGLGGGVEIVGPAHHRGYPEVGPEFERSFKSSVERYGLTPTSYGSYADPFMLPDRDLNPDELVAYTVPQLRGAAKLGFPVARLQYFVYPVIEQLLPYAEKLKIKLGYEFHVPLTIESDTAQMLIRQVESIQSEYLGLIPDCGIFARSVPRFAVERALNAAIAPNIVQRAVELWTAQVSLQQALVELSALGLQPEQLTNIESFWGSFGQSEPAALRTIMPYIVHMHGKFFSIEDGTEPDIRYEEVVRVLVEGGYTGWISSEYEGRSADSLAMVQAHQAMIHEYSARYAAQQSGAASSA